MKTGLQPLSKALIAAFFLFAGICSSGTALFGDEVRHSSKIALSLCDSIRTALLQNKQVQIQEEGVLYAEAGIMDAKSVFLPQAGTSFSYTHNDAVMTLPFASTSKKDPGIFTGYKNDNLVNFYANETFYNGGANSAALQQAKIGLKVQQETLRAMRLEVEFETKRLFYGILLAYETKRIASDLVGQARAHYEETCAQFGQGTASKFDVLQSKVQVSRMVPQLINAEASVELITAEFKKLLSIDLKKDVSIDGTLMHTPVGMKEEACLQEAYKRNPEMILKLLGIDLNKWAIEYAKAGWLPQITGSASYTYNSNDVANMFNPRHDNWNMGVKASIPIFDGFATKAKVDEARAKYVQSGLERENTVDQIAVDIRNARLDLEKAQAIIDAEIDSIDEAKEALRLSEVRYLNGVGINLDVLDAQVALAQVEQALATGIYDYIMAAAQLDKIMGRESGKEA